MKKVKSVETGDLRPEYRREDLGKGVRGKYYAAYQKGSNQRRHRHSREGGNPVRSKAGESRILDSRLRGNDGGHGTVNGYF